MPLLLSRFCRTGYSAQWRNAATLEGKAIEASLGIKVIKSKSVTWDWKYYLGPRTAKGKET